MPSSPYQHLFSTNAVLNVWRNLRSNRDQNDLLLTFQYQPDDVRRSRYTEVSSHGKNAIVESSEERDVRTSRNAVDGGSRSIGFVVPWRSMQAQKQELKEKDKELAEALVVLAGEVAFTDLSTTLQTSLSTSPLIQIRHLFAGLSRQLSKIELQMADNAPFCRGKNLYTGGEIARKFLPPIKLLFDQRPAPQRMIFELLMELKDMIYAGMADCSPEVMEWELNNFATFEELDEVLLRAITPVASPSPLSPQERSTSTNSQAEKRILKRFKNLSEPSEPPLARPWLTDPAESLYHLESLETTSSAMTHLTPSIPDFCAKTIITLRRTLDRRALSEFVAEKKRRVGRCAEYARCMKWAGTSWRMGGGCRRGCKNEDEDPEGLPSWHSSSRHFVKGGEGTKLLAF
ncbi:hypothetical protein B0J11DRAFT_571121 [Dendryphion nanum]|uniref:Uncharacterized protein n=1 Tax=Dendryphion nanum TaxID=256645 RepID=A0A9P9DFS2_9PLEO|nr:hypothetical protein B0J11DRAFT_571121 [Dendryphion nanum]